MVVVVKECRSVKRIVVGFFQQKVTTEFSSSHNLFPNSRVKRRGRSAVAIINTSNIPHNVKVIHVVRWSNFLPSKYKLGLNA